MISLFEVNLCETLPSCKISENTVDAGEWILFCFQLRIYGALVVAAYSVSWQTEWALSNVFKMAAVVTRCIFGSISSYLCTGSVDTAEPVSSSILRVWPLTFGVTQITSQTACLKLLKLLTSKDPIKLSSASSSAISKECNFRFSSFVPPRLVAF